MRRGEKLDKIREEKRKCMYYGKRSKEKEIIFSFFIASEQLI